MATRTSSAAAASARAKKQKAPVASIVLGILCLILLAGLIYFLLQYNERTAQAERMVSGLNDVADASETEAFAFEVWTDELLGVEAAEALTAAVATHVTEKEEALIALEQRTEEADQLRTERDLTLQQLRDSRSEVASLTDDLSEVRAELAELQETHAAEGERLNAQLEERDAEVAALRGELEEARAALSAARSAARAAGLEEGDAELPLEDDIALPDPLVEEDWDDGDDADRATLLIPDGESELFRQLSYDAETQQLRLMTLDGRRLVHKEVPEEIYAGFAGTPSIDIYYRVNILLNYPSEPDDLKVIRSIRRR